jgi:tRNA nucleotidyltransferase (CCA-adding enzyme)
MVSRLLLNAGRLCNSTKSVPDLYDNLLARLGNVLPVALRHIPDRIHDVAAQLEMRVALAGGIPRDLLRHVSGQLTREEFDEQSNDFDLVVEGPGGPRGGAGVSFAYELVRRLPGKLTTNGVFHTATIETDDGVQIDVATARLEEYPAPGQLPVVDVSGYSIEADLPRRDFSINALALELYPNRGRLIDPLGGAGDVRDRLVRILHSNSFSDDPTRLLRALRYSLRLNYDLEPATRAVFQSAIDEEVLAYLSAERVRYEVECIGREPRWVELWGVMDLTHITDGLADALGGISRFWALEDATALDIGLSNHSALLVREGVEAWLLRTGWLLRTLTDEQFRLLAARLGLYPRQVQLLLSARALLRAEVKRLSRPLRPSQIVRVLENWPPAAILGAIFTYTANAPGPIAARHNMLRYLDEYSLVRSALDGHALLELGAPAGPALGELLKQLRYLRLDGVIRDEAAERKMAQKLIRRMTPVRPANEPGEVVP